MIAILCGLTVLTLWGVVAPRGQWRVLAGWTRRNSAASEPGPVSVGVHRFVAILATVALGFAGWAIWAQYQATLPQPPKATSAIEQMWGAPDPVVLNRVISGATGQPTGLVTQPILRYQAVDAAHRSPNYLFALSAWKLSSTQADGGLVGSVPRPGHSALDSASIVVQVRGASNCIPRAVYTNETSTIITIGVYYGTPGTETATPTDCNPAASDKKSVSVLVPVELAGPVDKRAVQNVDGSSVKVVADLAD